MAIIDRSGVSKEMLAKAKSKEQETGKSIDDILLEFIYDDEGKKQESQRSDR